MVRNIWNKKKGQITFEVNFQPFARQALLGTFFSFLFFRFPTLENYSHNEIMERLVYAPTTSGSLTVCDVRTLKAENAFETDGLIAGQSLQAVGSQIFTLSAESITIHTPGQPQQTLRLPEELTAFEVSSSCSLLVGGSSSGNLYLWSLTSGSLIAKIAKHTQPVTSLRFTADEAFLFTSAGDGGVFGWRVLDLHSGNLTPAFSWDETHAGPVTALCLGYGSRMDRLVYTGSDDKTVRVWSLITGGLLGTYIMDAKVTALALDPAERVVYAGLDNGDIVCVDRFKINAATGLIGPPEENGDHIVTKSLEENTLQRDGSSSSRVASIDVSFDGTVLIAGYDDGQIQSFDTITRQGVSQVSIGSGVACVQVSLTQNDAPRNYEISLSGARESEMWIKIPDGQQSAANVSDIERSRMQAGHFTDGTFLASRVHELEAEIARVQRAHGELESLHKQLWSLHTQQ